MPNDSLGRRNPRAMPIMFAAALGLAMPAYAQVPNAATGSAVPGWVCEQLPGNMQICNKKDPAREAEEQRQARELKNWQQQIEQERPSGDHTR